MRIAVYQNLPAGGGKRAIYEEVKYLSQKHKLDLYELTGTDESFLDIRPFCEHISTYQFSIDIRTHGIIRRLVKDYQNFIYLNYLHKIIARDIDSRNYDVVLVHPDKYTQAPFLLRHLKTPSLYYCEEYLRIVYEKELAFQEKVNIAKRLYEKSTRRLREVIDLDNARGATKIVANSRFTQSNIQQAYNVLADYCHLGVDPQIFMKVNSHKGKYVLLIGDKTSNEGFTLIQTALNLIQPAYRPQIRTLGFSQGKIKINNDRKLTREYSQALITVCTSYNEPFGLAPLESMACETPVLAVNEGGYQETIVNGVTGYLLPRASKIFTKKIEYLINHPDVARRMGRAGREHVIKSFTWEKHCRCVEKHILKLINEKAKK